MIWSNRTSVQMWATLVTLALALGSTACDGLQGGDPVSVPSEFRYEGLKQLTVNRNGSYTLVWPSVPFDGAKYKVYSRKVSQPMDWETFQTTDVTTFVTDDLRFSESMCFAVRFFTPTNENADTNTKELCTEGFNYLYPGLLSLNRESSGVYTASWPAAPVPGVRYRLYEAGPDGKPLPDSIREFDGLSARVGPFPLGTVKCFLVRVYADGFPEFDKNLTARCTDNNRLTQFVGIESIKSTVTGQVQLSWSIDENPDVVGYIVYRGSDFRETYAKVDSRLQNSVVLENLEPYSRVSFGVRAVTSFGSEDGNTRSAGVQVFASTPPAFSGIASADLESANRVKLSWQSVPNVRSYLVYSKRTPKGIEPIFDFTTPDAEIPANLPPEHVLSGLGDDERYTFAVRAVSVFGVADKNVLTKFVETPDAGAPRFAGIKSVAVRDGKVILNWERPVGEVSRFRIYMAKGSASAIDLNSTTIPAEPGDATTAVVSGFQNGADYSFIVRSEDRHGNRDSNLVSATVTASSQSLPAFFGYIGAQGIDEGRIETEFRVTPDANIVNYSIVHRPSGQANWSSPRIVSQDLTKTSLKVVLDNLQRDREYEFLVRAVDRWGNSSNNQDFVRGRTLDNTPPLFAGISNVAQLPGKSELTISWPPSPTRDISYYRIYSSPEPLSDRIFSQRLPLATSISVTDKISADKSEYTFDGLEKGRTYYFVVRAFDLYDNEEENTVQLFAVVQNTFPSLGFDQSAIATPEGVNGAPITLTASDPDLSDTLTFQLDSSSTCNLTIAPIGFEVFAKIGKQRKAVLSWRPPFGYIPAGRSTFSCTVTYTVSDGSSTSPPNVLTLTAVNRAPHNVTSVIAPAANPVLGYLRNSNLTCVGDADDDDGNLPVFRYQWIKNGVEISGATQSTLSPAVAQYQPGDVVRCMTTADDEHDQVSILSSPVTMGNVPPDLLTSSITKENGSLPVRVDDIVACAWSGRDLDGDPVSFGQVTLQASLNGGATWVDPELPLTPCTVVQQNKRCYTVTPSARRASLRCQVASATDGYLTVATPFASAPLVVANSTPSLSGVALTSSTTTAQIGTVLSCGHTVIDKDNDSLVEPPQIRWFRNLVLVPGANAQSYVVSLADRGQPLACEVTLASNADGFGSAQVGPVRSGSMVYTNSNPRVDAISISPTMASTGTVLTCNTTVTDPDGDTVLSGSSYRRLKWYSDDGFFRTEITGETSATYVTRAIDRGRKISCELTILAGADGSGSAELTPVSSSNEVVPMNTSPVITSVSVTTPDDPARTGTTLSCNYSYSDIDGDSLVAAPVFSWTADNVSISGANSATYTVLKSNRGKAVRCRVGLPPDSDGKGGAAVTAVVSGNSVTPLNSNPEIIGVTVNAITSAPFYPGTELSCNASTIRDQDNDALAPYYRWFRNGVEISGAQMFSYTSTSVDRGQNLSCAMGLAANADGFGSAALQVASSNQFLISNRPPTNTFQAVLSVAGGGLGYKSSQLNCSLPSAATLPSPLDPDGDSVTYRYVWKVGSGFLTGTDGTGTASGTNMDLTGKVSALDSVTCQILLSDGIATSLSSESQVVTINNRAPVFVGLPALSPTPVFGSGRIPTLTCVPPGTVSDPDGDSVTLEYRFVKRFWNAGLNNYDSARFNIESGNLLNSGGWDVADSVTTDHPGTVTRWIAFTNIVSCEVRATDPFGGSVSAASAEYVVVNAAPEGSFTCNNGESTVVTNGGAPLTPTAACTVNGLSDADGDVLTFVADPGQTTCPGVGSSLFVDPVDGRITGTAPLTQCVVSIVVRDPSSSYAAVAGVTSRVNISFVVPFQISFGAPYVDSQCKLIQPANYTTITESYQSSNFSLSALAQAPHVYSNPGTPDGFISGQLNPANGGGNVALTWSVTGSGGRTNSLSRTIVVADSPAMGSRSTGVAQQVGLQPLPVEVSDGAGGQKSGNCALASCDPSSAVGSLAAGVNAACAVASDGRLFCWGDNSRGQLGRGTYATVARPEYGNPASFVNSPASEVDLGTLRAKSVSAGGSLTLGSYQACSVVYDPTNNNANRGVYCWGDNFYGQLGRGATSVTPRGSGLPQQVTGLAGGSGTNAVAAVAVGGTHACALMNAASQLGGGALKCWGLNDKGQLGDGSRTNLSSPAPVAQFETAGARAVAAGSRHTCAITNVGRVKCWGENSRNQLGFESPNPTEKWSVLPVEVPGLGDDVIGIAAGGEHTCALKQTGEVRCWGSLSDGQVGNGGIGFSQVEPAPASGGVVTGALAVSAGGAHSCALMENGGMKCWGRNSSKQLGAGLALSLSSTPVDVLSLSFGAMAVAAGENFTCVLTNDSKVKCFGDNSTFQLGLDLFQVKPENAAMPNAAVTPAAPAPALRQCRELRAYVP